MIFVTRWVKLRNSLLPKDWEIFLLLESSNLHSQMRGFHQGHCITGRSFCWPLQTDFRRPNQCRCRRSSLRGIACIRGDESKNLQVWKYFVIAWRPQSSGIHWASLSLKYFEWCPTDIHSGFFFEFFFTMAHIYTFSVLGHSELMDKTLLRTKKKSLPKVDGFHWFSFSKG